MSPPGASRPATGATSEPLVSVSLPYFDSRERLPRALASLMAQSHESWECIFVDDGATGRPREVNARRRFAGAGRPGLVHRSSGGTRSRLSTSGRLAQGLPPP